MGRIQKAGKNIIFGYISNLVILLVNFIQRTVFIYVLGMTLSGVNGVYTDVLSVLSLTELGIGTALNYSLYKPVAERDYEKIKSYMRFYKRAYLTIAGVIAVRVKTLCRVFMIGATLVSLLFYIPIELAPKAVLSMFITDPVIVATTGKPRTGILRNWWNFTKVSVPVSL